MKTIMVVDDETNILQEIKTNLMDDNIQVIGVSDSREALELMRDDKEDKYGLILIDTLLPGTNKTALFSMKPKSKIHMDVNKDEDFLQKPFTIDELKNFVKRKL